MIGLLTSSDLILFPKYFLSNSSSSKNSNTLSDAAVDCAVLVNDCALGDKGDENNLHSHKFYLLLQMWFSTVC